MKSKFHTRSNIRIQLPDGYILQGTFGAMEKMEKVYEFIRENLFNKERTFSLFEPTPRRVFDEMDKKLFPLGLVPQGNLKFKWEGDEPMIEESSFCLDLVRLKAHIIN